MVIMDAEQIIKDYEPWLKKKAWQLSPSGECADDLMQEGRLAMWRALKVYDPERGPLGPFLITLAGFEMGSCIKDDKWSGSPVKSWGTKNKMRCVPSSYVDSLVDSVYTIPEGSDLAFHQKEIVAVIKELPARQREYIVNRFWKDLPGTSNVSHGVWDGTNKYSGARAVLREKLKHLEGVV